MALHSHPTPRSHSRLRNTNRHRVATVPLPRAFALAGRLHRFVGDGWVTSNKENRRNRSIWQTRSGGFVLVSYFSSPVPNERRFDSRWRYQESLNYRSLRGRQLFELM